MRRRSERERALKHEHLDESRGVPMLKPGVCTRQVANDTGGRVGVAESTLCNAGDGAYVLKGFKEDEKICRYKGSLLKTRAEINEASLTSEYVLEYHGIAIDARDAGTCTSRFINDALEREAWNCKFRLVGEEVWVFATRKIEKWEELLLPYGWEYWWRRRLTMSKAMLGMAARAYPQISELLNSGRCKLTKKQRLRNRRIRDTAPRAPSEEEAKRIQREIGVWKAFPLRQTSESLTKQAPTSSAEPRRVRGKKDTNCSQYVEATSGPGANRR